MVAPCRRIAKLVVRWSPCYEPRMEVRVLGAAEVVVDDGPVALAGAKPRLLLAALALRVGETVSADRLIEELWGESPPETALNTLQGYVSGLRKALGAEVIERRTGGYALAVEPETVDVVRFKRLVAEAERSEPSRAAALLRSALALWRGEPELDAPHLEELRLAALEQRLDADLQLGRAADVVPELEALVREHPLRERVRAQLMLALYRGGRQADALEAFRDAKDLLRDELGLDPSPELQELERAILRQDAQLGAPAQPAFALPLAATPIVGRTRELARADALLDGGARLVTFTGPGGIGKTRLALEVAQRRGPRHADGALFVGLDAIDDPELVAPTILRALDAHAEADLATQVRGRELLLLLDNFEQTVSAAPLVAKLLAAAPGLTVLVTSRKLLHVAGEHELPVPPLAEARELFFARARAVAPGLDVSAHTQTVDAICEQLEGLPLAIELAAARARLLPPASLLERLTSRLELLTGGRRDAPERQRTVRATIDWSYRLLEPAEQTLFARLAVFVGGASLAAAEEVCGEVATLDALAVLVDSSLLQQLGEEEPRFRMLETLREYALEQLAAMGETEVLQQRHREFFLRLARESEPTAAGPDSAAVLARLEAERANLRAAVASAIAARDADTAAGLGAALQYFWLVLGHAEEDVRVLESIADLFPDAPLRDRNRILNSAGVLLGKRGDYAAARVRFEQALATARELGDQRRIAVTLSNLGNIFVAEDELEQAGELYAEALAIHEASGQPDGQATVLENIGMVALAQEDTAQAVSAFERALACAHEAHMPEKVASASISLARALLESGDLQRARTLLADAIETLRELGERDKQAECLEAFARLAIVEGSAHDAAALLGAAETLRESVGVVRGDVDVGWYETTVELVRATLGDELERELARGRSLSERDASALCV